MLHNFFLYHGAQGVHGAKWPLSGAGLGHTQWWDFNGRGQPKCGKQRERGGVAGNDKKLKMKMSETMKVKITKTKVSHTYFFTPAGSSRTRGLILHEP